MIKRRIIFFEKESEGKKKEKRKKKKITSIIEQQSRNAFSLGKKLSLYFLNLAQLSCEIRILNNKKNSVSLHMNA
jgi:hypothetical protein